MANDPQTIKRGEQTRSHLPTVVPAAEPLEKQLKEQAVYEVPAGGYVFLANIPEVGWHLLTEHGRDGRHCRLDPRDGRLTVVWESDGFPGPVGKTLDDFTLLAELAEWCDDCRKWTVPQHAFYCDMTDLTHGGFWRVRRPHIDRP